MWGEWDVQVMREHTLAVTTVQSTTFGRYSLPVKEFLDESGMVVCWHYFPMHPSGLTEISRDHQIWQVRSNSGWAGDSRAGLVVNWAVLEVQPKIRRN